MDLEVLDVTKLESAIGAIHFWGCSFASSVLVSCTWCVPFSCRDRIINRIV